jgi:Leucine-rich repeat (LRR) protein
VLELDLSDTQVSDISALSSCCSLTELSAKGSKISEADLSAFRIERANPQYYYGICLSQLIMERFPKD